jgi:hypothetical protein
MVTVQVLVPVQAPLHPVNVEPGAAVAVRTTLSPWAKFAAHVAVQLMPDGALTTLPLPVPPIVTPS